MSGRKAPALATVDHQRAASCCDDSRRVLPLDLYKLSSKRETRSSTRLEDSDLVTALAIHFPRATAVEQ